MTRPRGNSIIKWCDGIPYMELRHRQSVFFDPEDIDRIRQHNWYVSKSAGGYYVWASVGAKRRIAMHRFVMNLMDRDKFIDHIDGNPLNNQKYNLRICSHAENSRNRRVRKNNPSGFKGVELVRTTGRFRAKIRVNGKDIPGGSYGDAIEAAKKYNEMAIKYFGEFAWLNKIPHSTTNTQNK